MYDCSNRLKKFYDDHVRLNKDDHIKLAGVRDANLNRLSLGLKKLSEKNDVVYPDFKDYIDQGSYAMHTLNQHPENDYDIDVGIVFDHADLPTDPLKARQRIADAMKESGDAFKEEPQARTNAVTMWYADGFHVDFAIYRKVNANGEAYYEHASTEWRKRDPLEMNRWFKNKVDFLSPQKDRGATVDDGQMRRIVRLVKFFAKSRPSWNLPGGMILSTLVAECYISDTNRDDLSLVSTLRRMKNRLTLNKGIASPVEFGAMLTEKQKFKTQVSQLLEKLNERLPDLNALDSPECTEDEAVDAWSTFFNHKYWDEQLRNLENEKSVFEEVLPSVTAAVSSSLALEDYSHVQRPQWPAVKSPEARVVISANSNTGTLKPSGIVFDHHSIAYTATVYGVSEPYEVYWQVVNTGAEAKDASCLRGDFFLAKRSDGRPSRDKHKNYENAQYHGVHWIECFIIKNDNLVARSQPFYVKIFNRNHGKYRRPRL